MRVIEAAEPLYEAGRHYYERSPFAARWVSHPRAPEGDAFDSIFACRYALAFRVPADCTVRIRVSADERYVLWLDGERLGRGPERGHRENYFFETYDLTLTAGEHVLAADVHSLGRNRPYAQVSVRHAFVLLAEGDHDKMLSTGVAPWTATQIDAYAPIRLSLPKSFLAVGARFSIDAARLHAISPAVAVVDVGPFVLASMRMESPGRWQLASAPLPPMIEAPTRGGSIRRLDGSSDRAAWNAWLASGESLTVPPHADVTVLIALDDYRCVYPRLAVDGGRGARIALAFAEAMFEADGFTKSRRDRVDGLHFVGIGDAFLCDGEPTTFEPLWWHAGRFMQLSIRTAEQPLRLGAIELAETRYPVMWDGDVETSDAAINSFLPIARRTLEMCSHETFVDCPYYEQLMYVGDSRLEALVTYGFSEDDRLPRKAIALFDQSRAPDGWTQSRAPTKTTQVIPPFSWWWVGMVHDLAMWRDRPGAVAGFMPGVRAVMEAAYREVDRDGLYRPTTGWNFVDWVPGWAGGMPPNPTNGPLAPLQFHVAYAAGLAADLEAIAGEPLLARRHRERVARLNAAGRRAFFDSTRDLFADDLTHAGYYEHAQCLALLAGAVEPAERERFADALIRPTGELAQTTIYFSHYLFETLRSLGRIDAMFDRLSLWTGLAAAGFRTTPESPEPSRSDCHGWGAHPLYHLHASVLGVRPASAGFKTVEIVPQLGPLEWARGTVVHPAGRIRIEVRRRGELLKASVELPAGVSGTMRLNGHTIALSAGERTEIR